MKIIAYILFTVFCLTIFGCNNKQAVTTDIKNELIAADTMMIDDETLEDYVYQKPSIALFTLYMIDNPDVAFVPLSDIYSLSEHPDSIAIPNVKEIGFDNAQYFNLESKYREMFLSKTGISETDSVFVYDYAINSIVSFSIEDLNLVAMINFYSVKDDWPFTQYDYMIGFELDRTKLKGFSDFFRSTLAYVGRENPFALEQLTPIVWEKISADHYPSKEIEAIYAPYIENSTVGSTYLFETDSLQYFLQDYMDISYDNQINYRRLLVVEPKSKDIIIENFFGRGEGTSPSPLNYEYEDGDINQWTGKLLKNKPLVVFGFEYISFGCPYISIINKSNENIYLYCDNRH